MQYTAVELKTCELCGALYIRPDATAKDYCKGCMSILRAYPDPARTKRRGRPFKNKDKHPTPPVSPSTVIVHIPQHDPTPSDRHKEQPNTYLSLFHDFTECILHRYAWARLQPCRLGHCLREPIASRTLRVNMTKVYNFEDCVLFIASVEKCIEAMPPLYQKLIKYILVQEYTQAEAATILSLSVRTVSAKYPIALDMLTRLFIVHDLMTVPGDIRKVLAAKR